MWASWSEIGRENGQRSKEHDFWERRKRLFDLKRIIRAQMKIYKRNRKKFVSVFLMNCYFMR